MMLEKQFIICPFIPTSMSHNLMVQDSPSPRKKWKRTRCLSSQSIFRSSLVESLGKSPRSCLTLFMSRPGLSSTTGHSELEKSLQPWKLPATTFLLILMPRCHVLRHCPTVALNTNPTSVIQ